MTSAVLTWSRNVELYDLQRHPDVMRFFGGQQAGASNFLASVGIRDVDKKYANLGHNAGNDVSVIPCLPSPSTRD